VRTLQCMWPGGVCCAVFSTTAMRCAAVMSALRPQCQLYVTVIYAHYTKCTRTRRPRTGILRTFRRGPRMPSASFSNSSILSRRLENADWMRACGAPLAMRISSCENRAIVPSGVAIELSLSKATPVLARAAPSRMPRRTPCNALDVSDFLESTTAHFPRPAALKGCPCFGH
jgi:hypothetical protein